MGLRHENPPTAAAGTPPPAAPDVLFDGGTPATGLGNPPANLGATGGGVTPPANSGTPAVGGGTGANAAGAATVSIPANWKDALPPELRDASYLRNVDNVETLVKNYGHAQSMVGKEKIVIPGPAATPEQWKNDVYVKLGLPEKVEDFKVELDKTLVADPEFMKEFTKTAHENGILPRQATALANWFGKANDIAVQQVQAAQVVQMQKDLGIFKSEVGDQAYNQTIGDAKRAMSALPPEVTKALREKGLGNDVNFIKAMATLASGLKEGAIKGGGVGGNTLSQESAIAMVEGVKKLPASHPYWDDKHPDYAATRSEYRKAFDAAFPDKA